MIKHPACGRIASNIALRKLHRTGRDGVYLIADRVNEKPALLYSVPYEFCLSFVSVSGGDLFI